MKYPDEIFSNKHDKQECFIIISPRFSTNAYKHAADSEERTKVHELGLYAYRGSAAELRHEPYYGNLALKQPRRK